jgi:hypothetical protein
MGWKDAQEDLVVVTKSIKSLVKWLPWPSRIRRRHFRRAFFFVLRSKTCLSQANPRSLFDHPVGELLQKVECFPATISFTQLA